LNGCARSPDATIDERLWKGDWSAPDKLTPMEKMQIELSDVISFTTTVRRKSSKSESTGCRLTTGRFYARSTWRAPTRAPSRDLPVAKKYKVAAFNWALLPGKHRPTCLGIPAETVHRPRAGRVVPRYLLLRWEPYRPEEAEFIKQMTGYKGKRR